MNDSIVKKLFKSTLVVQILAAVMAVLGMVLNNAITGIFLGNASFVALGFAQPIALVFSGTASVFSMGISVLCGKTIGSGNKDETNRVFSQCVFFALVVGIAITAVVFLGAQPVAALLGSSGEYLPETAAYLRGVAPCSIAIILVVGLLPIMQIDGDRSRAVKAVVAATVVNVALSLANGLVLRWGLFGMAVALTLGYFTGAAVILLHFRGNKGMFRLKLAGMSLGVISEMLSYGLPNGLQQICRSVLGICMNLIIKSVADPSMVGVLTAINTAALLCMAFGTGIGQSTSVIVSVLAGEKDVESMKLLLKNSLRTAVTIDAVLSVVMFVVAPFLMRIFLRKNPDLLDTATLGFRLYCLSIVVYAINVTIRSYYQAMHLTRLTYPYVLLDNLLGTAVSAFVLSRFLGTTGVWLSFLAGEAITLAVFLLIAMLNPRGSSFLDKIMRVPEGFTQGIRALAAWSCAGTADVKAAAEGIREFCGKNGGSERVRVLLPLAAEEMCMNIVQYGFADNKSHSIDVKAMRLDEGWLLRIRDDCDLFDPVHYLESQNDADPYAHMGIRMIDELSCRMEYVSTLKMNNLLIEIAE